VTAETTAATAQGLATGALPLRQDDPISMALVIKTMLVMALLLLAVYLVLRWYSRRGLVAPTAVAATELHCVRELRLSPRTRAYLLDADGQRLLVTESTTGVTVTPLERSGREPGASQ
jgi:flagellar biogenesis protein FliO